MSRGNYYYKMGWIGNKTNNWASGEMSRFNALKDGIKKSVIFLTIGTLIEVIPKLINVGTFSYILPLLSFIFVIVGIISMLNISEKGPLYVGGWTFISVLLFIYNIIGFNDFLIDLIPISILSVYLIKDQIF
jgi:hypothetical protein